MLVFLLVIGCVSDVQGLVLSPLLGKMAEALHLSSAQTSWAVNSQSIAAVILTGLAARYADIIGHRKVLLPLLTLGVIGSLLCALATSFQVLLAGRLFCGMAVCAPMAWAMLRARANDSTIAKASHYNGTAIATMTPISLILGGLLLSAGASWNSSFWLIAAGFLAILIMAFFAQETPAEQRIPARLDLIGSIGLGLWLLCLLLALSNGGTWGWNSGATLGLFAAAVAIFIAWVFQQRSIDHALMDFRDMDTRQVAAGYVIACVAAINGGGIFILVPAFAQTPPVAGYGFGSSVLLSSCALLPILPAAFIAGAISRRMVDRWGPRVPIWAGGLGVVASFLIFAFAHTAIWEFYIGVFVYAAGAIVAYNVSWALCAAAARNNNMATTFGIQYGLLIPASALLVAVVLAVEYGNVKVVPTLSGAVLPKEGAYTALFIGLAVAGFIGFVLNGLFLAPRRLRHQNARAREVGTAAEL
jgi:MFS family permease